MTGPSDFTADAALLHLQKRPRALAIVNPAAGGGRARGLWSRLERALARQGIQLAAAMSAGPGHARRLARDAVAQGFERVVAVGGDGTVSEVGGALAGSRVALAVVAAGTGNDLSATLGLPADPIAAMQVALGSQAVRLLDVGGVEHARGRVEFLNVAGIGFDAEVARRLQAARRMPFGSRRLPYALGVLRTLLEARPRRVRLTVDGVSIERRVLLVAVANGPRYGGGMLIAPRASLASGWFEVCVVGDVSRREVVRLLPAMYRGGHQTHPKVEFVQGRQLRATCLDEPGGLWCHADGEVVGSLPVAFSIRPASLRCVVSDGRDECGG